MRVDVVVPTTRPSVRELIESIRKGTFQPDTIWVVSNEQNIRGRGVKSVVFSSEVHPIGMGDAGLRRNIGADLSNADILVFLDDDQLMPRDSIEQAVRIAESEGFCWGHHRFVPFEKRVLLDQKPEKGRSRETGVNQWHGFWSSYAGFFAIQRNLFWEVGGFDLGYLGYHGSEDQQFGRRLSLLGDHKEKTYIWEPPFAWHPETPLHHSSPTPNTWGTSRLEKKTINGHDFMVCRECPYRVPLDVKGLTLSDNAVIPYSRDDISTVEV